MTPQAQLEAFVNWRAGSINYTERQPVIVYTGDHTKGASPSAHKVYFNDPYDAVPFVASAGKDSPAILEMYGMMSRLVDNTTLDPVPGSQERVAIFVIVSGKDTAVAVTRPKRDPEFFGSDEAEGFFGEALTASIEKAHA